MSKAKYFPLVLVAIMSALGTIIYMMFPEIPLVPGVEYLKVDLSDIPALVTGLTIGPQFGVVVELIKNIIHLSRTATFGIGELMNICIGSCMIYSMWFFMKICGRFIKSDRNSVKVYYVSSALSIVASIICGWILNAALTPLFYTLAHIPLTFTSVMVGVWSSTLLNAIKCAVTVLPFWPLIRILQTLAKKLS